MSMKFEQGFKPKRTVAEIKAAWNDEIKAASESAEEGKASEVLQALTEELAIATAYEENEKYMQKVTEFIAEAKDMIALGKSNEQMGLRGLTQEEQKFFEAVSEPSKFTQSLNGGRDLLMPTTTVSKIYDDMKTTSKLLGKIRILPAGLREIVLSSGDNVAEWGDLFGSITEEVTKTIFKINLDTHKLSAVMYIPKSLKELGMPWIDKFVRDSIKEAMLKGAEKGVAIGTGKQQPIGIFQDIELKNEDGTAQDKTPTTIANFSPTNYGAVLAPLTKDGTRELGELTMLVNPLDYLIKVMPAMLFMNHEGKWVNMLPVPTEVIQCRFVPKDKVAVGDFSRYVFGGTAIKTAVYDQVKAIDDMDTYVSKMLANGQASDNADFVVLDITNLEPISTINATGGADAGASETI